MALLKLKEKICERERERVSCTGCELQLKVISSKRRLWHLKHIITGNSNIALWMRKMMRDDR